MATLKQIERLYNLVYKETFGYTNSLCYSRLVDAVDLLCDLIESYDNGENDTLEIWCIGEHSECMLGDLIIGFYWHASMWYGSPALHYSTFCKLGGIYTPSSFADGPETDSAELACYNALEIRAEIYKRQVL